MLDIHYSERYPEPFVGLRIFTRCLTLYQSEGEPMLLPKLEVPLVIGRTPDSEECFESK